MKLQEFRIVLIDNWGGGTPNESYFRTADAASRFYLRAECKNCGDFFTESDLRNMGQVLSRHTCGNRRSTEMTIAS